MCVEKLELVSVPFSSTRSLKDSLRGRGAVLLCESVLFRSLVAGSGQLAFLSSSSCSALFAFEAAADGFGVAALDAGFGFGRFAGRGQLLFLSHSSQAAGGLLPAKRKCR